MISCSDGLQNGQETGIDCGGPTCAACPFVVVLATGSSSAVGASWSGDGGWVTTPLSASSDHAPGLATIGGFGVGLIRAPSSSALQYLVFDGGWSGPTDVAGGVTTQARPAACSTSVGVAAVFHGLDYKYYLAAWTPAGGWSPTAEQVGNPQSYGPVGADLACFGPTIAFINGAASNHPSAQTRDAGTWGSVEDLGGNTNFNVTPAIVALSTGPELLMVWVRDDGQVLFATRTSGAWATPAAITNVFTNDRVGLTALRSGEALLAFRGQDSNLYWSRYTGSAWSTVAPFSSPNVSTSSSPAVCRGLAGAEAELVFIQSGNALHSRLVSSTWTTPLAITDGGTLTNASVAAGP